MSIPITWQNVMGPSLADASRPLEAAQRTFSGIFDNLGGLLKDAEMRAETGRNMLKDKNRDQYLDVLAGAKTPEELAAAQLRANQMRASFGDNIRSGDIRGADERRLVDIRTNTRQGMEFDSYLKDERSKPFMEAYRAAAVKGDKLGMASAEAAYSQAGGPKLSALMEYGDQRARLTQERGEQDQQWLRNGEKHTWDGNLNRAQIGHMANQDSNAAAQLTESIRSHKATEGISGRQVSVQEATAMMGLDERLENREAKLRAERAATFRTQSNSLAGQGLIEEAVASIKDPDDQKQARIAAAQAQKKYPNAPTSAIIQNIKGLDASWSPDFLERAAVVRGVGNAVNNGTGTDEEAAANRLRDTLQAKIGGIEAQRAQIGSMFGGKAPAVQTAPIGSVAAAGGVSEVDADRAVASLKERAATRFAPGSAEGPPMAPAIISTPAQPQANGVKFDPKKTYERGTPEWKAQVAYQTNRWNQDQIDMQSKSRLIADKQQAETRSAERADAQRRLSAIDRQIEALNGVTDKNTNKKPALEKARANRERLMQILGN